MAAESSFDVVCKIDMQEMDNAVNQVGKELAQRFDFKGSKSKIDFDRVKGTLTLHAEDDFRLRSMNDILQSKVIKRGISLKALVYEKVEQAGGDMVRQLVNIQQGIPQDKAKEIVRMIKDAKIKVGAAIQQDHVRVTGKNKDDLQAVIALLRSADMDIDMQFVNYR